MSLRVYLAGLYTTGFHLTSGRAHRSTPIERWWRRVLPYHLESYFYIQKPVYPKRIREDGYKVFLDSGAFSAFTKKVKISLPEYCDYIKRNRDIIEEVDGVLVASVLDGIGDAYKTWENQVAMEKLGVQPLPCFHYGEDERFLEHYVANYPYITLGGMVMVENKPLRLWLDRLWSKYLTKSDGTPKLKVHGFGMTDFKLMRRYPWYSVDSSSWAQIGAYGNILIPGFGIVPVSKMSPKTKQAWQHFNTLPQLQQEAILKEITKREFELERLQTIADSRWIFNCVTFTEIGYQTNVEKFIPDQMRLF